VPTSRHEWAAKDVRSEGVNNNRENAEDFCKSHACRGQLASSPAVNYNPN